MLGIYAKERLRMETFFVLKLFFTGIYIVFVSRTNGCLISTAEPYNKERWRQDFYPATTEVRNPHSFMIKEAAPS